MRISIVDRLRATADAIEADARERATCLRATADEIEHGGDARVPLHEVMREAGLRSVRAVADAGRYRGLVVQGPRGARYVQRRDLDRWLARQGIAPRPRTAGPKRTACDLASEVDLSLAAAAARVRRSA